MSNNKDQTLDLNLDYLDNTMSELSQQKIKETKKKKKRRGILLGILIPVALGGIGTGIYFGVKSCSTQEVRKIEIYDSAGKESKEVSYNSSTTSSGDLVIILTPISEKVIDSIEKITINDLQLTLGTDYTYENGKIIIKKDILNKNPGTIIIVPILKDKPITGIKLSITEKSCKVGDKFLIKASAIKEANEKVKWTASAPNLISFSSESELGEEIEIEAKAAGTVNLTAAYGTFSDVCKITITEPKVSGITISKTSHEMSAVDSFEISAALTYTNDDEISWTLNKENIVTISASTSVSNQTITVYGANEGEVNLTASSIKDPTIKASCKITITEKPSLKSIELSEHKLSKEVGDEFKLSATLNYASNEDVIDWEVDGKGDVEISKPIREGNVETVSVFCNSECDVIIRATCGECSDECSLSITQPEPTIKYVASINTTAITDMTTTLPASLDSDNPSTTFTAKMNSGTKTGKFKFTYTPQTAGRSPVIIETPQMDFSESASSPISLNFSSIFQEMYYAAEETTTVIATFEEYVPVVEKLTISGENNIDINTTSSITFTAKNSSSQEVTSSCTWSIVNKDDASVSLGSFNGNVLTLSETAKKQGGSAIIKADIAEPLSSGSFEVEIATFNKFETTSSTYGLPGGFVYKDSTSISGDIVTPSRYYWGGNWVPTTTLLNNSFGSCPNITSIFISKSITTLEQGSFDNDLKLIKISENNNVYSAPSGSNCIITKANKTLFRGFATTVIPSDSDVVTTIGESAFSQNLDLTSITIPQNITKIEKNAFFVCNKLTSVTFSGTPTVKEFGESAFNRIAIDSGTTFTIPSSVEKIAPSALEYTGFGSIEFADRTKEWIQTDDPDNTMLNITTGSYNKSCFDDGSSGYTRTNWSTTGINITTGSIKEATVSYDSQSFYDAGVDIQSTSTETIRNESGKRIITVDYTSSQDITDDKIIVKASSGTTLLEITDQEITKTGSSFTIEIPENKWTSISPFDTITVSIEVHYFNISNGGLVSATDTGIAHTGSLTIPTSINNITVTGIADNGFENSQLSQLTFETSSNITSIGNAAFKNSTNLTWLSIPDPVTTIGDSAFEGCTSSGFLSFGGTSQLTSLGAAAFKNCGIGWYAIPEGVTEIKDSTFEGCTSLFTEFNISSAVTSIGKNVFKGCTNTTQIKFEDTSNWIQTDDSDNDQLYVVNGTNNGTNFKDTSSGLTGYNWATTGIVKNSAASKSASISIGSSFEEAGVIITAPTTKIRKVNDKVELTLTYTSPSTDISGWITFKSARSGSSWMHSTITTFSSTGTEITLELDIEEWDSTHVQPQDTLTLIFSKKS